MKKDVNDYIKKRIDNEITYNDFKDKINVNQYIYEKNQKKINYRIMMIYSILCFLLIGGFLILNMKRVNIHNNDIDLYNNDKEWIDAHDFVFVAKVEEELKTKKYDGTGTDIPYTFYRIKIVNYLKGNGENEGKICFYGGKKYLNTWSLYRSNDEILEINQYYLFFTNKKISTSINNRIGKDDFIITRNDQKIKLSEYQEGKSINEQSENNQLIIKRFTNIINKVTNFDINIPVFNNTNEMIDNFNYIFIAQVTSDYRSNVTLTDIPIVYYNYSILTTFKNELPSPHKICYYGVNYWYDETSPQGLQIPVNDGVYLIFANLNQANPDELFVQANYQQVKLDNYNLKLPYLDQSDNIKEIVNEYIKFIDNLDDKYS